MNSDRITSAALEPGSVFAREYRIERPLRSGGMGSVLIVEHISTGKRRALKVLSPELELHAEMRERFVREARAAAAIESEHVVEIVTAGIDEETNRPYIVMELLQGEDLGDRIERSGPLDQATTAMVLRQLGHALGAAHRQGIIHRDLKPENVFLAEGRRPGAELTVKLLDFGVAKILTRGAVHAPTQPLGSPLFMSPEQTDADGEIGPGTDVWALGLLAFFLLTGEYFWIAAESCSIPALLREVCFDDLPPASVRATIFGAARDVLPAGFDAWFARCVSRKLTNRFPDGETAANALADLLDQVGLGAAATPISERATPRESFPPSQRHTPSGDGWTAFGDGVQNLALTPRVEQPPAEDAPAVVNAAEDSRESVDGTAVSARLSSGEVAAAPAPAEGPTKPPAAAWPARLRARIAPVRHVVGGVVAGCMGGALCFLVVGLVAPGTPATASASSRPFLGAPSPAPTADHERDGPSRDSKARLPNTKAEASSAQAVAAGPAPALSAPRPTIPPKRVRFAYEVRAEDSACLPGMRRVGGEHGAYCIDAVEVTLDAWSQCVAAGLCTPPDGEVRFAGVRPDAVDGTRSACIAKDDDGDTPVNCVDRASAAAYCGFRGARLPTDAEWTLAAFGQPAKSRRFPWGDDAPDVRRANVCDDACVFWTEDAGLLRLPAIRGDDGAATLAPVGHYPTGASPDLVLDLIGNVAEWTFSDDEHEGIVRGGSFLSTSVGALLERRVLDPRAASPEIGFRCASEPADD